MRSKNSKDIVNVKLELEASVRSNNSFRSIEVFLNFIQ
ncbi:hypothetical protein CKA32_005055 [Geitlerinema sp. FC II]|nr:hypothetical protein CKA32_005055 [Geitlerinema sp. FC II]